MNIRVLVISPIKYANFLEKILNHKDIDFIFSNVLVNVWCDKYINVFSSSEPYKCLPVDSINLYIYDSNIESLLNVSSYFDYALDIRNINNNSLDELYTLISG